MSKYIFLRIMGFKKLDIKNTSTVMVENLIEFTRYEE